MAVCAVALAVLGAPDAADGAPTAEAPPGDRAHVLFIAFDDLNDWIGPLGGHPQAKTPHFDRLAQMSATFTNAQTPASVCNPARAAIMTGVAPQVSGVYNNFQLFREAPLLRDAPTLPQYFAEQGYRTTARGKIFHYPDGVFADLDSWQDWVPETGEGQIHPARTATVMASGLPILEGRPNNLDWAPIDLSRSEMKDFQNAEWVAGLLSEPLAEPTFIACGIFRPHLPWYVPPEYFERFPLESIVLPDSPEEDLSDLPWEAKWISGGLEPDSEYHRLRRHGLRAAAVQAYLASVAFADDCLGRILDAVEASPDRDDLIVVVWSDHGFHLGEKFRYKKETLWEESTRSPLFIIAPGVTEPGSRIDTPVDLLDLYPTLLDLCGLPPKPENDGASLRPLLLDPSGEWPHPALTTIARGYSLRTKDWRYTRYLDGSEELYDHRDDPNERVNRALDPACAETLRQLRTQIPQYRATPIPVYQGKH